MSEKQLDPRLAIYPGSFDPITLGHLNVMERAARLFDRLIVAVGIHREKNPWFLPEERVELIRLSTAHIPNIEIHTYGGLTVEHAKQCGAKILIRGVRPITDIPAELTMMMANRSLAPEVETLFLVADGELAHVSSSLIKEIATATGGEQMARFLPPQILDRCCTKFHEKKEAV